MGIFSGLKEVFINPFIDKKLKRFIDILVLKTNGLIIPEKDFGPKTRERLIFLSKKWKDFSKTLNNLHDSVPAENYKIIRDLILIEAAMKSAAAEYIKQVEIHNSTHKKIDVGVDDFEQVARDYIYNSMEPRFEKIADKLKLPHAGIKKLALGYITRPSNLFTASSISAIVEEEKQFESQISVIKELFEKVRDNSIGIANS